MLFEWLQLQDVSDQPALISAMEQRSWIEFGKDVELQSSKLQVYSGKRVGLPLAPSPDSIIQLFALASVGAHVFLTAFDAADTDVDQWASDLAWSATFDIRGATRHYDAEPTVISPSHAVTILTSGTTGRPKAVEHTWESLTRPVRKTTQGQRWLLTYRPNLYAGLQVVLQCLANRGCLIIPGVGASAEDVAALAAETQVEFASATPSYWRWLLTLADADSLQHIPLRQITLGGEAVDQPTLDALKRTFPTTRLVHIYATTELGRCFSVSDGKSGFPSAYLEETSKEGVQLKIDDGELVVRSANAMAGYDRSEMASPREAWFHTGDLVKVDHDRVHFAGRTSDMINVGGNKVYPLEVEAVVRSVKGVADTRVYGEPSSIVGQLVKCDVVVVAGLDPEAVEKAVRAKTRESLNSFQRPRFISIVDQIPRTEAGKTRRGR